MIKEKLADFAAALLFWPAWIFKANHSASVFLLCLVGCASWLILLSMILGGIISYLLFG